MHTALTADLTARHVITTSAINYSSEIGEQLVPDSIAAKADLVYDTLGQEACFGAHGAE